MGNVSAQKIRRSRKIPEWLVAIIFAISFLLPSFQVSKNWKWKYSDDESNNCTNNFAFDYKGKFSLPSNFCQRNPSSSLQFLVSAAPVEISSKSVKKKNKKKSSDKVECLIDESKGFKNAANVYQCAIRQTCCFEYAKPSCCGSKPTIQIIQEQITLWGGLLAILAFISAIVFCRRKDFSLDFSKLLSFGCCSFSGEKEGMEEKKDNDNPSQNEVTKKSFLKKSNKVGALDMYPNTTVTVNKLKDSMDQKNTNENNLFHKEYPIIEDRNIRNLRNHFPDSVLS